MSEAAMDTKDNVVDFPGPDESTDIFAGEMSNPAEEAAEGRKLLLPAGWYTTTGDLTTTPKVKDGRKSVRFFGTITRGETTAKIGFGFSPDLRHKDGTETPDFSYGQYLQAVKAYKTAAGIEKDVPVPVTDVIQYVAGSAVQVRVVQTQDGENMVVAIKAGTQG